MKWKIETLKKKPRFIEPIVLPTEAYLSLRKAVKKSSVIVNAPDYIMLKDGTAFEPIDRQLNIEGGK